MALYRIGIDRIRAHIDAALPLLLSGSETFNVIFPMFWISISLGDLALHVISVVAQLAVLPEPHDQVVEVRDLVGGRDAWANRREGVERLAKPTRVWRCRPRSPVLLARRNANHRGVTKYGVLPVLHLHHLGETLDDQRQLS
jgi:hypothetical protein